MVMTMFLFLIFSILVMFIPVVVEVVIIMTVFSTMLEYRTVVIMILEITVIEIKRQRYGRKIINDTCGDGITAKNVASQAIHGQKAIHGLKNFIVKVVIIENQNIH